MRVLLDTNILISFLLTPESEGTIFQILKAIFEKKFTLIVPAELLDELSLTIVADAYLRKKITKRETKLFLGEIKKIAKIVPTITAPIPSLARDLKDDYLLAYALVGEVDYLVTGDSDLLSLGRVGRVKIISPKEFLTTIS